MSGKQQQPQKVNLDSVNVINELQEFQWKYEEKSENEVVCLCPKHEHPGYKVDGTLDYTKKNSNPNCQINLEKKEFICFNPTCNFKGNFVTFLSVAKGVSPIIIHQYLVDKYGVEEGDKIVDGETNERWFVELTSGKHPAMLKELYDRGISDEIIRWRRYGYDGKRITIPVPNGAGNIVNVRRYLPGAPGKEKFKNLRGRGELRLYHEDQFKYDTIIICGGETKADATAYRLNEHGIGAICAAGGEGAWEVGFSRRLKGKKLYVMLDIDAAGIAASTRRANELKPFGRWVGVLNLPLNKDVYPKGDISDYWGKEKKTVEEFLKLLATVDEWIPPVILDQVDNLGDPIPVELENATDSQYTNKLIEFSGNIAAIDTQPYLVPKLVGCQCDRNTSFCAMCPVFSREPNKDDKLVDLTVNGFSPSMLSLVESSDKTQRENLKIALGIPSGCRVVQFQNKDYHNVFHLNVSPQLDIKKRTVGNLFQPTYYVGSGVDSNAPYNFTARVLPHPRDQHAVLLANSAVPAVDSLDTYKPSVELLETLKVFRPLTNSVVDIGNKLNEIYTDFENNVTNIYYRPEMHLMIDLAFHSVLRFSIDSGEVKGWVEILILGDSSTGKSQTVERMINYYGLGQQTSAKMASESGFLGGVDEVGNRKVLKWGVFPKNDRRLLFIEELKGAPSEIFSKLTDMRSSGIATVEKIQSGKTHARTRLIITSNTRSNKAISAFTFGIESVKELLGHDEDIRRFDTVLLVAKEKVSEEELSNRLKNRQHVENKYKGDLCRHLILWCWTRDEASVVFTEAAINVIFEKSLELSKKYTDSVPIVDRGSMRYKIARLAIALAGRLFSTNEDYSKLVVLPEHVVYISDFLDKMYSSNVYGYEDLSKYIRLSESLKNPNVIIKELNGIKDPLGFIELILAQEEIDFKDVNDWTGYEFDRSRTMMGLFVTSRALKRVKQYYFKTPAFIELLKDIQLNPKKYIKTLQVPNFMTEAFARDERLL